MSGGSTLVRFKADNEEATKKYIEELDKNYGK